MSVREWRRMMKMLSALRVITEADADTLARYCYLYGQLQEFAVDIAKRGEFIMVTKVGRNGEEWEEEVINPRVLRIEKMLSELRQIAGLLGLDPSSRSKLSIQPEVEDPLEAFLKKKETTKGLSLVGGQKK